MVFLLTTTYRKAALIIFIVTSHWFAHLLMSSKSLFIACIQCVMYLAIMEESSANRKDCHHKVHWCTQEIKEIRTLSSGTPACNGKCLLILCHWLQVTVFQSTSMLQYTLINCQLFKFSLVYIEELRRSLCQTLSKALVRSWPLRPHHHHIKLTVECVIDIY